MAAANVGKREAEKAASGENPKTLALIMDLLERAADAKLSAKNSDVIASWAATDHLQKGCVALGVFQVSGKLLGPTITRFEPDFSICISFCTLSVSCSLNLLLN